MKPAAGWRWILAGVVALGLFLSSDATRTHWKRKRTLEAMQKRLAELQEENKRLTIELHRLESDPRAIEPVARRELGMIQPGEIEYRFILHHASDNRKAQEEP